MDRKAMVLFVGGAIAVGSLAGVMALGAQSAPGSVVDAPLPPTQPNGTPQLPTEPNGTTSGATSGTTAPNVSPPAATATLTTFGSDAAWQAFLSEQVGRGAIHQGMGSGGGALEGLMAAPAESAPIAAAAAAPAPSSPVAGLGGLRAARPAGASDEGITNTQVQGVDEGDIVKVHGEHLVVLRRGRLFTVRIGDRSLSTVSVVDAPPPGAQGGWYDEMLVSGDTVVVIGYNYQSAGTELGLFNVDASGVLSRRGTYYLRSGDYYSSRNYASRLLGSTLVFYMPIAIHGGLPAIRHENDSWRELIRGERIYRPVQNTSSPMIHAVVRCDLAPTARGAEPSCRADAIVGPSSRSFYVSANAVYLWVGDGPSYGAARPNQGAGNPDAMLYRLPLGGGTPGALHVYGQPTDQLSFDEAADGHLDVLVRSESGGDGMWQPQVAAGDIAVARLPIALMNASVPTVSTAAYTPLPRVDGWSLQNRFVGDWVLYSSQGNAWQPGAGSLYAAPVRGAARAALNGRDPWISVALGHGVERIEVMGDDAVVVGSQGSNLAFDSIALTPGSAQLAGHFELANAAQDDTRTHGFFYRQDSATGGVLGLPVRSSAASPYGAWREGSTGARVLFLGVQNHQMSEVGTLDARAGEVEDHCVASCTDWYGNARPIFWRGRIFALMGYELVEGALQRGRMVETGRTTFFGRPTSRPHFGPIE